jgi:hypothetical protein
MSLYPSIAVERSANKPPCYNFKNPFIEEMLMTDTNELNPEKMEQGKLLAKILFGFKESELLKLSDEKKQQLKNQYPLLSEDEFHNVIVLVLDAKARQQKMIALQMLPKNVTLILVAVLTWLTKDWKIALILSAFFLFSLILFSSAFRNLKLGRFTTITGWLSYLAIIAFGYFLFQSGTKWNIAVLAAVGLWAGSLLVSWLVRLFLSNLQTVSKHTK